MMKHAKVLCLMLLGLCWGCGGKAAVQGPEGPSGQPEAPQVRVTGASFVATAGAVRVQWVQTGGAVQSYVLERQHGNAAYQRVAEAQAGALGLDDAGVIAGESARYRVGAVGADGKAHYSEASVVSVPGARLDRVNIRREDANAEVRWHADAENALAYEVVREVEGGEAEVVYVSGSGQATSYEEGPVVGNVRYTYRVRTVLKAGARVESRPLVSGLYVTQVRTQITSAQGARMRLALEPSPTGTSGPRICIFAGLNIFVMRRNYSTLIETGAYDFHVSPVEIESGSFTGYTLHAGAGGPTDHVIVGIHPDSRQVIIQKFFQDPVDAYSYESTPYIWDPAPEDWEISAGYRRTAVARDNSGRLFVTAGGALKIYSVVNTRIDGARRKAGLIEIGSAPLPEGGDAGAMVMTGTTIWLSLHDKKRLFRGDVVIASNGVFHGVEWQDMTPSGVVPGALTVNNSGQVLVRDVAHSKIWILNSQGDILTHINLVGAGYEAGSDGDLIAGIASGRDVLFVANATGQVEVFITQ